MSGGSGFAGVPNGLQIHGDLIPELLEGHRDEDDPAVADAGRPPDRGFRDRSDPDGRSGFLEGFQARPLSGDRVETAVVVNRLLGPEPADDLDALRQASGAFLPADPEGVAFFRSVTEAHAEHVAGRQTGRRAWPPLPRRRRDCREAEAECTARPSCRRPRESIVPSGACTRSRVRPP